MLTDLKARQAKPAAKDYKLADSGGITFCHHQRLQVVIKYRFGQKEKPLVFGR
jgi:hypothetical protein